MRVKTITARHKVFTYIMLTYSPLNFQFSRAGERGENGIICV